MKPRDTVKQDTSDVVMGPTLHRDNVTACDTMNIMLLDSQGTVPLSSRNESQRSSISNAETVAIPQSLAAIALDTGHTFRDDFDHGIQIDTRGATEFYRIDDDSYRPFTIYGSTGDGKGKIATLPASTTGSLSSIITTSIASSEPDRVDHRSGGDGGTGCSGSLVDEVSDGRPLDQKCAISCGGIAGAPGASADNGGDDGHGADIRQEKWWYMTLQIAIPFFVAGVGTIGAGIILGHVENWKVFVHISELFILVPSLLGLKGNLDMCLASRLSTQANLGNMSGRREIFQMVLGNIALVQVQATVASFIVSMFAVSVGAIINGTIIFDHVMLLTASAMFTATSSCFVLADYIHMSRSTIGAPFVLSYLFVSTLQIMLLLYIAHIIIHLMWKWKIDPDNSAIPYLTALGDLFGSSFLMLAFLFLRSIGHPYGEKSSETVDGFKLLPELTTIGGGTLMDQIQDDKGI
uniref:SLC41A/MgtE integral membrane domain-containing protein n=1 Tax=Anopheles merus TaxID=30066 RepID=A0A182UYQ8_ANOME